MQFCSEEQEGLKEIRNVQFGEKKEHMPLSGYFLHREGPFRVRPALS